MKYAWGHASLQHLELRAPNVFRNLLQFLILFTFDIVLKGSATHPVPAVRAKDSQASQTAPKYWVARRLGVETAS